MIKTILSAAAFSALALNPSMAETTTTTTPVRQEMPSAASFPQQQTSNEWRSSNLIGAKVMGTDNQSIGKISDLVIGQNGGIQAVVVGVGGFLGMGEKNVAIPFKDLALTRGSDGMSVDKISVTYTKEQLTSAPNYKYLASNS